MEVVRKLIDDVLKIVIKCDDGLLIESVLIEQNKTSTICVSSQVGCSIGCIFCKSGEKFTRNLKPDEILFQINYLEKLAKNKIKIVFMGMGEPFLNYENLLIVLEELCVKRKNRISKQDITISTIGICDKIKKFSNDSSFLGTVPVSLAISLHFTTDELRKKYIPNCKSKISEIVSCAKEYLRNNKNAKLMIEYILLKDINDSIIDLENLVKIIKELNCVVNIIEYNGNEFKKSEKSEMFKSFIISKGYKCFIRKTRGDNINAACGMLVSKYEKNDCC